MKLFNTKSFRVVILLCFVCIAYSASLKGDFQLDDFGQIVNNSRMKDLSLSLKVDSLQNFILSGRPVTAFTFALNYSKGRLDPFGYHLVNLAIHLVVVILLYFFTYKVLRFSSYKNPHYLALIIAGIFGLHPLQSQAVSYIVQRGESLASMFYLLSLLLFITAVDRGLSVKGFVLYFFGFVAFIAGIGSKEIAATLPLAYILFDYYFLAKRGDPENCAGNRAGYWLNRLAVPLPFLICGVVFFMKKMRAFVGGNNVGFNLEGMEWTSYLLTEFKVLVTYLRLIMLPVNQNLDYDYPLSRGFFEPQTLFSFLLLFFLLLIAGYLLLRDRKSVLEEAGVAAPGPVVSFGICWFFLLLAPTSTFIPIIDVIFEHRTYLASWGIIAALVVAADATIRKANLDRSTWKLVVLSIIVLVMTFMAFLLHKRAGVWKDKLSLWSDTVKKSPYKARPHVNLAHALRIKGKYDGAVREYLLALRLPKGRTVSSVEILKNLGVTRFKLGQLPEAIGIFRKVLIFEPGNVDILNNLSICLMETGKHDEALSLALRAEVIKPLHGGIKSTLGEIYMAGREYPKSLAYFKRAIKLNPDVPVRHYNTALVLEKMERFSEACAYWEQYLDLEKSDEEARQVFEHMAEITCP